MYRYANQGKYTNAKMVWWEKYLHWTERKDQFLEEKASLGLMLSFGLSQSREIVSFYGCFTGLHWFLIQSWNCYGIFIVTFRHMFYFLGSILRGIIVPLWASFKTPVSKHYLISLSPKP
jgi:hypothetical protein